MMIRKPLFSMWVTFEPKVAHILWRGQDNLKQSASACDIGLDILYFKDTEK